MYSTHKMRWPNDVASSSKGTAAEVTSTGTQSFSMNSQISGSEPIEDVRLQHQFLATHGEQRAVGISVVTEITARISTQLRWRSTTQTKQRASTATRCPPRPPNRSSTTPTPQVQAVGWKDDQGAVRQGGGGTARAAARATRCPLTPTTTWPPTQTKSEVPLHLL